MDKPENEFDTGIPGPPRPMTGIATLGPLSDAIKAFGERKRKEQSMTKAILITGDPVHGYTFWGPFQNMADAISFGEERFGSSATGYWWAAPLEATSSSFEEKEVDQPFHTDGESQNSEGIR